jgi:NAD-dependent SIR2 family protein deacetylase
MMRTTQGWCGAAGPIPSEGAFMSDGHDLEKAAAAVAAAEALIIGAGAGMGVDSGLPDFRGNEGFWKAYPPFAKLRLSFAQLANPCWFRDDPGLAWGFYGHRLNLYRAVAPHEGFQVLRRWAERMPHGAVVYTSNVDGHFQRAGFDPQHILEVHGSIHWMQCLRDCGAGLFPAEQLVPDTVAVDEATMRAEGALPACPSCGGLARPNILLFGDGGWDESRSFEQEQRLGRWLREAQGKRVVVVECGAGTAIPTVRHFCEAMADRLNGQLIRINVREPHVLAGHIGLALGARAALAEIDRTLAPTEHPS